MAKKIKWSPKAIQSFEEICNYISKDSEYYASIFAKKINAIVKEIPRFPKLGRIVPEYQEEDLREKIFQSYRIVYRLKADIVEIVVISHAAKQLDV